MIRSERFVCVVLASFMALTPPLQATDIWVSGQGSDAFPNDGSLSLPYRTITKAMNEAGTTDVIKVLSGDYDVTNNEVFPISIKAGVDILGQETDPEDWPRIGGDVADSSVRAIFEVIGNSANGDRIDIVLRKLRFVAEDAAGKDAPSAAYLENSDRKKGEVTIDNCIIERGEMNDSGSADRASIVVVGGDAYDVSPAAFVHLDMIGCTVTPTEQGGVEVRIGSDADDDGRAFIELDIRDSTFALDGSRGSRCAIDFLLEAYEGTTGLNADLEGTISGNLIDSSACTSGGFTRGMQAGGDAKYGGSVGMNHSLIKVTDNEIRGCSGDAMQWFSDIDTEEGSFTNIQSWFVVRNVIAENGGSGIVFDYGDGAGAQYMGIRALCNMIFDNGGSGIEIINMDDNGGGTNQIASCTIAGNTGYGIELVSCSRPDGLSSVQNNIVWSNDSGTEMGWDETSANVTFTNNDWQLLFGASPSCTPDGDGNVDINPEFVDSDNGDYHLKTSSPASCLIGKGTNTPAAKSGDNFDFDFERDRRIVNGDADIGADEGG